MNLMRIPNREIKAAKEAAYVDLEKCAEEKEEGNQAFKLQDFPTAVRHYSEALKRGPPGVRGITISSFLLKLVLLYVRVLCFTSIHRYMRKHTSCTATERHVTQNWVLCMMRLKMLSSA